MGCGSSIPGPRIYGRHRKSCITPVSREQHPKIQILRCIVSDDSQSLTLFLKDTTYVTDPSDEVFFAGRVAVWEKFEGQGFFLTVLYHEWFIVENK